MNQEVDDIGESDDDMREDDDNYIPIHICLAIAKLVELHPVLYDRGHPQHKSRMALMSVQNGQRYQALSSIVNTGRNMPIFDNFEEYMTTEWISYFVDLMTSNVFSYEGARQYIEHRVCTYPLDSEERIKGNDFLDEEVIPFKFLLDAQIYFEIAEETRQQNANTSKHESDMN